MNRKIWLLLIIIAGFMFIPQVSAIDVEKGVIFLSEVGGGNITFAVNITTTGITWVGDQVRLADLVYDGNAWGDIGFSAPPTSTTMNITFIDGTHITIDTTQTLATTYEVYLNTAEAPNVTGATTSNYASPTLTYNMAASGTVELDWVVTYILLDSYTEGNGTTAIGLTAVFPGTVPGIAHNARGQTFNSTTEAKIGSAVFYIQRVGSPTGDLHAALYAHTGTFGTDGTPTGALLALSDPVDIASLGVGLTLVTFNFTGANRTRLEAYTQYGIGLQIMSGSITLTNRVGVSIDGGSPTHEGNSYSRDVIWEDELGDFPFYVYGIAESPVNLDAETDGFFTLNKGEWLNVTVRDLNGWENLDNVTVKLDTNGDAETVSFQWIQSTDNFTEIIDASSICVLNASRSTRVTLNASTISLNFNFNMTGGTEGNGNATVTSYDTQGFSDVDEYEALFGITVFNITNALWQLIDIVFGQFGIVDFMTQITTYITSVAVYFSNAVTSMVILIVLQFKFILNVFPFIFTWMTAFLDRIISMGAIFISILNGTNSILTGIGNLWDLVQFGAWTDIIVMLGIFVWIESIARRGKTYGELQIIYGDLQIFANILGYFMSMFATVVNIVVDNVFRLFEAIT